MVEDGEIRLGVRRYIQENFLVGEPVESLRDSTLLLTTGTISSLTMLELVAFLENEYSVRLRERDLTPDRLDSIDRIVALVQELQTTS